MGFNPPDFAIGTSNQFPETSLKEDANLLGDGGEAPNKPNLIKHINIVVHQDLYESNFTSKGAGERWEGGVIFLITKNLV